MRERGERGGIHREGERKRGIEKGGIERGEKKGQRNRGGDRERDWEEKEIGVDKTD